MDKIEKIPIPEDVKRVLDNVSHILIGLNYRETARAYKQAVEKLISLSKEPDKSLKEAAEEYIKNGRYLPEAFFVRPAFIAGAEWQASQMPMPEDTVLFQKGVAEGRRLEKEDMLKDAEECELYWVGGFLAIDLNMAALGYSERDKVKVIVLKAEKE